MSHRLVSAVLTTKFDLAVSSSSNNPTQVDTILRQEAKRKRNCPTDNKIDAYICTLPSSILNKWDRIAGPKALTQLWLCLWAKRWPPSNKKSESTLETSDLPDTSIEGRLTRYQLQYQRGIKGILKQYQQFAEVPWRLYLANIISLYMREKARKNTTKRRKRNRGRNLDAANTPRKSVYDIFVDFLLPELLKEDSDTREEAKRRFDNWIQHAKRWGKLVEPVG